MMATSASMDISLYASAPSSPIKSPSDCPSSLASASLDFSQAEDDTPRQYATVAKIDPPDRTSSIDSSCTLVPEVVVVDYKRPYSCSAVPDTVSKHKANTNPFINNADLDDNSDNVECAKILRNRMELLTSQLSEIGSLEKHVLFVESQLKVLRESLSQIQRESCQLIETLLHHHSSAPKCDAQTQTEPEKAPTDLEFHRHHQSNKSTDSCNVSSSESDSANNDTLNTHQAKHCFRKLSAFVKGYLVRRLAQTEKVQQLKRTIRDTSTILMQFKENLLRDGKLVVTHQDILFHQRLCIQLENSCKEFYAIFFETPIGRQMELIARHREYLKNLLYLKEKRTSSALSSQGSSALSQHSYLSARFARAMSIGATSKLF